MEAVPPYFPKNKQRKNRYEKKEGNTRGAAQPTRGQTISNVKKKKKKKHWSISQRKHTEGGPKASLVCLLRGIIHLKQRFCLGVNIFYTQGNRHFIRSKQLSNY